LPLRILIPSVVVIKEIIFYREGAFGPTGYMIRAAQHTTEDQQSVRAAPRGPILEAATGRSRATHRPKIDRVERVTAGDHVAGFRPCTKCSQLDVNGRNNLLFQRRTVR